jgi:tRNASer (uridine44-2'-O)-methyltransferase
VICKHGEDADYVKKGVHDVILPQATFQNRYALLKTKYARSLIDSWAEQTDPQKHVFEDLGIAAFLIELWADMYRGVVFPGFVDIGCGNGLLVYILNKEGYAGWGFDARSRTSWKNYQADQPSAPNGKALEQRLLVPYMIPNETCSPNAETIPSASTHDGRFPPGTFIISNHADELTPWTPILAAGSGCPFIMIPCCSHDLSGAKYRAPPPKDKSKGISTYASLVEWVSGIAADCGFLVETEMLRIPSTRNTGLLGRSTIPTQPVVKDILAIIQKHGGTGAYSDTVARLVKTGPGGH